MNKDMVRLDRTRQATGKKAEQAWPSVSFAQHFLKLGNPVLARKRNFLHMKFSRYLKELEAQLN